MQTLTPLMLARLALVLAVAAPSVASAASDTAELDAAVLTAVENCIQVSESRAGRHTGAKAALVFSDVVTVELGAGGAGGKGALVENGKSVGYYDLGEAKAGFEAGVDVASYIFMIETPDALAKIRDGKWSVGADAGITIIDGANANAETMADVVSYVVGGRGLDANVSVDLFHIWPE